MSAAGGGRERVRRQVLLVTTVPGSFPATQREQQIDQGGSEAPHQHSVHPECGASGARRMADGKPVVWVGELGERHPGASGYLGGVAWGDRARLAPPSEHRRDGEPAPTDEQLRQHSEHLHPGSVDTCLLGGLPECRGDRAAVRFLDRPAWKGWLARVPAPPRAPLDKQQVGAVRPVPEEHEYRRGPTVARWRAQSRRDGHPWCRGGPVAEAARYPGYENGPALTSARAVFSSVGPSP